MSILYSLTSTINLKKIADGQKPWGNESRQNLDIIDAYFNYVLSSGKVNITNDANNVVQPQGGLDEAEYHIHSGVNSNTRLLRYTDNDKAFWMISGADTAGYTNGNDITLRLRWTSQYTTGQTRWRVEMSSLNDDDTIDPAFTFQRTLPLSSCSINAYGVTTVEFTFTPDVAEIQEGRPTIMKITRYGSDDTGDVVGNDVLFFGMDIVYNLPQVTPQQVFNYITGAAEETSNIDFTYDVEERVSTITETLIDGITVRSFVITYRTDGQIDTIVMTTPSHEFTETYTYNVSTNLLENISTVFVEI